MHTNIDDGQLLDRVSDLLNHRVSFFSQCQCIGVTSEFSASISVYTVCLSAVCRCLRWVQWQCISVIGEASVSNVGDQYTDTGTSLDESKSINVRVRLEMTKNTEYSCQIGTHF